MSESGNIASKSGTRIRLTNISTSWDKGIRLLADNPELGVKRDYVRDEYPVLFVARHAVYYTVTPSTIHIIRVLHGQMDPDRHL